MPVLGDCRQRTPHDEEHHQCRCSGIGIRNCKIAPGIEPRFRSQVNATPIFGERVADSSEASTLQATEVQRIRTKYAKRSRRAVAETLPDLSGYFVLEFDGDREIKDLRAEFAKNPLVESVHLDPVAHIDSEPNDPFLNSVGSWGQTEHDLWGLKAIDAETAWQISKGQGITVAVIDTGLDFRFIDK